MATVRAAKQHLLKVPAVRDLWGSYRSIQVERRYMKWMERYRRQAEELGLSYSPDRSFREARDRLQGTASRRRRVGECHTLIMTLTRNWGMGMVHELRELGPVTIFDWEELGFSESDPNLQLKVPDLNLKMLQHIRKAHAGTPVDWVFVTCSGNVILKDTIRRIREELGIPVVNQWLDCKQNFERGRGPHGQDLGQRDIAAEFDLVCTSARPACEWYLSVGGRPVFVPEGFSPKLMPRVDFPKEWDVGFVGACYGFRPTYIEALRKAGLSVAVAGRGWREAVAVPQGAMGEFVAKSRVSLGMGGVGYSMSLRTLKARDFEIPGAAGSYLTTFCADLTPCFQIGREICCYNDINEVVELAYRLARCESENGEMAERGYHRAMREHRWVHRFRYILEGLGVLAAAQPEDYG
jgi:hypothetical protein